MHKFLFVCTCVHAHFRSCTCTQACSPFHFAAMLVCQTDARLLLLHDQSMPQEVLHAVIPQAPRFAIYLLAESSTPPDAPSAPCKTPPTQAPVRDALGQGSCRRRELPGCGCKLLGVHVVASGHGQRWGHCGLRAGRRVWRRAGLAQAHLHDNGRKVRRRSNPCSVQCDVGTPLRRPVCRAAPLPGRIHLPRGGWLRGDKTAMPCRILLSRRVPSTSPVHDGQHPPRLTLRRRNASRDTLRGWFRVPWGGRGAHPMLRWLDMVACWQRGMLSLLGTRLPGGDVEKVRRFIRHGLPGVQHGWLRARAGEGGVWGLGRCSLRALPFAISVGGVMGTPRGLCVGVREGHVFERGGRYLYRLLLPSNMRCCAARCV